MSRIREAPHQHRLQCRHTERCVRILRHIGNPLSDLTSRECGEIYIVNAYRSRLRAQQLRDALDERRLARAVGAEQAEHLARGNAQRYIVKNAPLPSIAEGEMLRREALFSAHSNALPLRRIRWIKSGTPRNEMTMPTGIVTG